jgi:uncharacterized protein
MSDANVSSETSSTPQWKPLAALDRRVIGVLVEKAKTTPEQYPLTLNSLVTGCNQKNNRDPQMQVQVEDIEEAIERLRATGALIEVQGSGRVSKYRHMMYDWLGVNKVELGVMTELLLRGAQTEGELRGRAARMDPIADLAALRPIVESLKAKGLVVSLTSEGRGHVLTHALYLPHEMEALRTRFRDDGAAGVMAHPPHVAMRVAAPPPPPQTAPPPVPVAQPTQNSGQSGRELESLRVEISQLRRDLEELVDRVRRTEDGLREMRESLGG